MWWDWLVASNSTRVNGKKNDELRASKSQVKLFINDLTTSMSNLKAIPIYCRYRADFLKTNPKVSCCDNHTIFQVVLNWEDINWEEIKSGNLGWRHMGKSQWYWEHQTPKSCGFFLLLEIFLPTLSESVILFCLKILRPPLR